ncbi:MAG TPA: DMT family transporter [Limnochordales bacterium]
MAGGRLRRWLARHPLAVLVAGVAAVSSAAVWVRVSRLAPEALAMSRLGLAAAALWPLVFLQGRPGLPGSGQRSWVWPWSWAGQAALAGVALAAHWSLWFWSLRLTSVLNATVLVTTQPLFVVALRLLAGRGSGLRAGQPAGLALALVGACLVAAGNAAAGGDSPGLAGAAGRWGQGAGRALAGDALALAAAVLSSLYWLAGERLRQAVPVVPYQAVAYTAGAFCLWLWNQARGVPVGAWPAREWAVAAGLAAIPTLVGHSALNWVIGTMGAATVATAVLGEPLGASVLAFVLFGEKPSGLQAVGAACLLAGLHRFLRPEREPDPQART